MTFLQSLNHAIDGDNDERAAWLLDHQNALRTLLERMAVSPMPVNLQKLLTACGHRGDAFNVEYIERMGLQMAFYPSELINLIQRYACINFAKSEGML